MALPVPPPPVSGSNPNANPNATPSQGAAMPPPPVVASVPAPMAPPPVTAAPPVTTPAAAPVTPAPVVQAAPAPVLVQQAAPAAPAAPAALATPPVPVTQAPMAPAPMQQQNTAMSAGTLNGGSLADTLAELGLEGLDFGYGSLPIISLDQGSFKCSDGTQIGEEFYFCNPKSRPKYLFKTDVQDDDSRSALAYSYDGLFSVKGDSIEELIRAWSEKGCGYKKMVYLEVAVQMADNNMALLSLPPTSVRPFSGVMGNMYSRKLPFETTWIKAFRGQKVTSGSKGFFPWAFSIHAG